MASLFGHNAIRRLAAEFEIEGFDQKLEIVEAWHNDYHRGTLKTDKETSREQSFNQQFFGSILGYIEKPNNPFTFEPKASTDSGQLPDARIGFFVSNADKDHTSAVVELKGAAVSLDKPQKGHANLSPVQQGFKYKPQYRGCDFVIVSNFYETRLYNDNLMDFESWTLDDLVDPAESYLNLRKFIFLLSSKNLVAESGNSITKSLILETRIQQDAIGRKFYGDYKDVRASLISNLWLLNEHVRENPDLAIEKAQKILDRVVFSCFAEDKGFVPDSTLARVLKESSESAFGTVWSTLKNFFEAIDVGSDKLGIPLGFNGGLFAKDPALDELKIGDETLRKVLRLGNYNFSEDLSVNILGHIFEQSISDLEEIRSETREVRDLSVGRLSKRKKDGIFYTPENVVRTIIDKSLGEYLRLQESNCLMAAGVSDALSDDNFSKRQKLAYTNYLEILQNVRVLDPSCGSGAFIVGAFDFLLAENKRVNDILGPNLMGQEAFLKQILQNNIFGVDLNEESVEITKLSLWLKSATIGQKLTKLDTNIKCGNSLISESSIAGAKAFVWENAFPHIFDDGGFDVVVGNPPYVDSELMVKTNSLERNYISQNFESAQGNWDLFVPFYQRAFDLLKPGGICSMILPNKVLVSNYAAQLRSYLHRNGALMGIIDLSAKNVFDVDVYPVILTSGRGIKQGKVEVQTDLASTAEMRDFESTADNWGTLLSTTVAPDTQGPMVSLDEVFDLFSAATVAEAYSLKTEMSENALARVKRVVNTGTIDPYMHDWGLFPMTYIKGKYLHPVAPETISNGKKPWHSRDKVIVAGMSQTVEAVFSEGEDLFPAKSTVVLTEKPGIGYSAYVGLVLLNSDEFRKRFITSNQLNAMAGGYITISRGSLSKCKVPESLGTVADHLDNIGRKCVRTAEGLRMVSLQLKSLIQSEYGEEAWSPRLKAWWGFDLAKFTQALGITLSISQKSQLLPVFEEYQSRAQKFADELATLEVEAAKILGSLYGG